MLNMRIMKPVLPSLREKKRYVAFEVISKRKVPFGSVSKALWLSLLSFAGEVGVASGGVSLLEDSWNEDSQSGVVRVAHTAQDLVKASFVLVSDIDGECAVVRSLGSSGILAKARAFVG